LRRLLDGAPDTNLPNDHADRDALAARMQGLAAYHERVLGDAVEMWHRGGLEWNARDGGVF
jgi:hypothetical protein